LGHAEALRIQYAGARCHVMSRGDRREAILYDDADRGRVSKNPRPSLSQDRMASTCLLPDEQSFSSCLGDAPFLGFVDDANVIEFVAAKTRRTLDDFMTWETVVR
jgi:hypothetical protein